MSSTQPTNAPPADQSPNSHLLDFLFHGSCPRCHHFYVGKPMRLPVPGRHARYPCDVCQKALFGIGRSSAQTSLASIRTMSRRGSISSNDSDPPCADTGPRERAARDDAESTLWNTPLSHRTNAAETLANPTPNPSPRSGKEPEVNGRGEEGGESPRRLSRYKKAKQLLLALKARVLAAKAGGRGSTAAARPRPVPEVRTISEDVTPPSTPCPAPRPPNNNVNGNSSGGVLHEPVGRPQPRLRLDPAAAEASNPIAEKDQRIANYRRELTLKWLRLQQRKCYCHDGCHCMGTLEHGQESHTNADSRAPQREEQTPRLSSSISSNSGAPSHMGSTSVHVGFAGAMFTAGNTSALPYPSCLDLSRQSTSTSMSQATTAVDSRSTGTRSSRTQLHRPHSAPLEETLSQHAQARAAFLASLHRDERQIGRRPESLREFIFQRAGSRPLSLNQAGSSRPASLDFAAHRRASLLPILDNSPIDDNSPSAARSISSLSHLFETAGDGGRDTEQDVASHAGRNLGRGMDAQAAPESSSTPITAIVRNEQAAQDGAQRHPPPTPGEISQALEELASARAPSP